MKIAGATPGECGGRGKNLQFEIPNLFHGMMDCMRSGVDLLQTHMPEDDKARRLLRIAGLSRFRSTSLYLHMFVNL